MAKKKTPRFYSPPPDYLKGCLPEQALCYDFIIECILAGWRVYPEYPSSRFDMLLVAEDWCVTKGVEPGTQIGVQAKIALNRDLVAQLVNATAYMKYAGPDYVVGLIPAKPRTPTERDLEGILTALGHGIVYVYSHFEGHEEEKSLRRDNLSTTAWLGQKRKFSRRVPLPRLHLWVEPGVPSPSTGSGWKTDAVERCMDIEALPAGLTRKAFEEMKPRISISRWLQERWLIPNGRDGRSFIYILNPDSKDRPDRQYPGIREKLEHMREQEKRKNQEAEVGEPDPRALPEG